PCRMNGLPRNSRRSDVIGSGCVLSSISCLLEGGDRLVKAFPAGEPKPQFAAESAAADRPLSIGGPERIGHMLFRSDAERLEQLAHLVGTGKPLDFGSDAVPDGIGCACSKLSGTFEKAEAEQEVALGEQ